MRPPNKKNRIPSFSQTLLQRIQVPRWGMTRFRRDELRCAKNLASLHATARWQGPTWSLKLLSLKVSQRIPFSGDRQLVGYSTVASAPRTRSRHLRSRGASRCTDLSYCRASVHSKPTTNGSSTRAALTALTLI